MAEEKKEPVKGPVFIKNMASALNQRVNPEAPKSPEDEAAELKRKTEAAKARQELNSTLEQINNPESVQKIREQRETQLIEQASAATKEAKEAGDRERQRLQTDKEAAEQAAAAEEEKRIAAEKELQTQRDTMLLNKLEELKNSQKPLSQQLAEYLSFFDTLNEKLGIPKIGVKPPDTSGDPRISLEIERLRIEDNQKQRDHDLKVAQDKREWDLKLMEFERTGKFEERKLQLDEDRTKQLFAIPEMFGGAIAKGLIDRGNISSQEGAKQPSSPQDFKASAAPGESGEIDCPVCTAKGTPNKIGIGPTTSLATCVGCGSKFRVERTEPTEPTPPGEEG